MFSVLCNDDAKARLQNTPLKNGNPWICCTLSNSNIKIHVNVGLWISKFDLCRKNELKMVISNPNLAILMDIGH